MLYLQPWNIILNCWAKWMTATTANVISNHDQLPTDKNASVDKNKRVSIGDKLYNRWLKNLNRIIIAHLNINSIRNKFTCLVVVIGNYIDYLVEVIGNMISETKIDDSFPVSQFLRGGYTTFYSLDRNSSGGEIFSFYSWRHHQQSFIFLKQVLKTSLLNKTLEKANEWYV